MSGDVSALILTRYVLSNNSKSIVVTPVNSSSIIETITRESNSNVVRTRVGSVDVSRKMIDEKALIGYEENGGFMFGKHNPVRDGAMTMSILIDMLATKQKLADVIDNLPKYFIKNGKYKCPLDQSKQLIEHIKSTSDAQQITTDGIKLRFDENKWIMVRASGTEPIIRIYGEGKTKEECDSLFKKYCDIVETFLKEN
jgi:phosphomannomutase/phosphoglucomutase